VHRILALADVYLDAYPFAGACSMLDPIIVGVPPVVRSAVVGRSSHGASLMRMVGLYDRVCTSEEQYEAQAVSMAMDPAERAAVRDALLALRSTRPPVYFDTAVFSLRVGAALSAMHEGLARSYSRLNAMPHHELVAALQHLANRSVGVNFELNQLTDTGIVSALIEPLFPAANGVPHHVVDVGACYGAMSAPLISNGWTADLFEPDPGACAVLRSQLAAFGAACTIHERAIAVSPSGTVQFHKSSSHGLSGLADSPFGPTESVITVASTTLAEHCRKTELVKIDFLKIDAEGFDFDVLETHDFDSLRPRLIMVEYGTHFPRQGVAMVNEAIARMAQRGYGALVFAYSDDGNFERADWNYRLTGIQVDREIDEVASDADGRPFGNIIFYEYGDREFLLSFYALLETCMPPTQRESCAAMVH
jgi:FkbM family methyltransferase